MYQSIALLRDRILGKISRICLANSALIIFILSESLKNTVVNDDFKNVVKHFNANIIYTNFKKDWTKQVSTEILNLI
jgi:hypothetical protein